MFGTEMVPLAAVASGGLLTALGVMFGRAEGIGGALTAVVLGLAAVGCLITVAIGG